MTQVATRLSINGVPVGDSSTFLDSCESVEQALPDTRRQFEDDGYQVESLTLESLPR